MGRAPCCEKMGLKKGPWTAEEDKILVAHIESFGHSNWRALPKQAGLLRCGKSCRLRWINYLRPDIKRGNFSEEEEEAIIRLHEELGNRWSAIAARLPGRTDNEIKNVWHTHLKKRLEPNTKPAEQHGRKQRPKRSRKTMTTTKTKTSAAVVPAPVTKAPILPDRSPAASSSVTESSSMTEQEQEREQGNTGSSPGIIPKEESQSFSSSSEAEEFQSDEHFWSETLSMPLESFDIPMEPSDAAAAVGADGDLDYWLRVFMETGDDVHLELPPQI